jgi:hypothetical protein
MNIADLPTDGSRAQFAPFLPPMPDNDGAPIPRLHFDSLSDLAAFLPADPPPGRGSDYWREKDSSFYGVTMAEAQRLARDGWQEGAERVQPLLDRVKTARPTRRALSTWDVAGAYPSIPRYLAGNPLHMRRIAPTHRNAQPIITLVSSTSASSWVDCSTFERLATAAAAIVDRLEDAGYRVEILAGRRCSNDGTGVREATGENNAKGNRCEMIFRVKAAQDALDLARVTFGLGHPGVHRRILFAAGEMCPAFTPAIGSNQGYAVALTPLERPPGVYILPALNTLEKKVEHEPVAVFDHVLAALKDQGCPGLE